MSQDSVFAFLAAPRTHGGKRVRRIDTHAAAVFLAGALAYKVKRAVRFPFLDFTTLEQRRLACEAELEINRKFAPELYLRVVPIVRDERGELAIGGEGTPVEWAVEMLRFDEEQTLDRIAERGEFARIDADRLARAIVSAHAAAPLADPASWLMTLGAIIEQNGEELRQYREVAAAREAAALTDACRASLERLRPLLIARGSQGFVRRCHGDLHLGNVALIDDRPVLFDALEFDPLLASVDIFYDFGFMLMDLVQRRLAAHANVALNRYLCERRRLEDLDGLAALPLFMAVRAAIRAKVTAARLAAADAQERSRLQQAPRRYLDLALQLIEPPAPALVAIGGLSGTGKSRLARALAPDIGPAPGALVLRSDVERKALFRVAETQRLAAEAYRPEVTESVYAAVEGKAARALAAGHSVIADAVFARGAERDQLAAVAEGAGAPFVGLFLTADLATRQQRLQGRIGDASDATAEVAAAQEEYALGPLDWFRIDASGAPEETLRLAQARLAAAGIAFATRS